MTAANAPEVGWPGGELEDCRVLLVSHAADRSGAPLLLLWWLRWLTEHTQIRPEILLLRDGPLVSEFSALAPTHVVDVYSPLDGVRAELAAVLDRQEPLERRRRVEAQRAGRALGRFDVVLLNSALSGVGLGLLAERPPVVISWVHDMGISLCRHTPEESRQALLSADWFVTCADAVSETLVGAFGVPWNRIRRHHGFIEPIQHDRAESAAIRERLGVPADALVVGGAGTRQWRKGTDLFVQLLREIRDRRPDLDVHGVWAGGADPFGDAPPAVDDARALGIDHRFHVLDGYTSAAAALGTFDVFCLTSREDPFPLVMLEAAGLELPIVSFDNGGVRELAAAGGDEPLLAVVEYLDVASFADQVTALLDQPDRRARQGKRLRQRIEQHHVVERCSPPLLADLRMMVRAGRGTGTARSQSTQGTVADTPTAAAQEAFDGGAPVSVLPAGDVDVVTVDDDGRVLGTASRHAAHQGSGLRHLAVSIVVVDADGRLLLQRRADTKPLFAGLWSNTVCTHPLPAEDPARAAIRRLDEEMGLHCALSPSGTFSYQADDPISGLAENEFDHVFIGTTDDQPQPNPAEISAIRWVTVDDLAAERQTSPELFTPWLGPVLQAAGLEPDPTDPTDPADLKTSSRSAPTGATP